MKRKEVDIIGYSIRDLEHMFRRTRGSIYKWIESRDFPKPFHLFKSSFWDVDQVNNWIKEIRDKDFSYSNKLPSSQINSGNPSVDNIQ